MRFLAVLFFFSACASAKTRAPATSDPVPKCWKAYDPKWHDGLYHITIPANDSITAREVQRAIGALQAFGVQSHSVSAVGVDSLLLEAQFLTLAQGKAMGYGTQEKLEELVSFVLKDELPLLEKGAKIECFRENPIRRH